jgi:serine protease
MNIKVSLIKATCASALVLSSSLSLYGQPSQPDADILAGLGTLQQPIEDIPTNQLIIKYREDRLFSAAEAMADAQMARLSARAGVALTYFRPMSGEAHVLRLPGRLPLAEVERIAARLSALPEVAYAEPDYIMMPMLTPNDPQYGSQWHYHETYGINLPQAWDITTGNASTVVAVIDTGHRPHVDLASRIVGGYDFITNVQVANDGNARDADPQDPGDWITAAESSSGYFAGCPVTNSTWHGTHVAGTIGAVTNNGQGVAGVNWGAKLLSVRVLGKCGGATSDIADGMRWAAGLSVPGVPNNPNPAKVLNLSLGGNSSTCPATFQSAIHAVNAAGGIVVVAAGNSNTNASGATPANCNGVITVGATNRSGVRAWYSNYGSVVDVSAPGGQTSPTASNGVLSTLNAGTTTPAADNYVFYQGTSMAAPHVAGVVSLMVGLNPSLTSSQVETVLKNTAKPFGPGHTCTGVTSCGAGIVNAHAALQALTLTKRNFLPRVGRSGSAGGGNWVTITQESFEGATFPPPGWATTNSSGFAWGRRNCLSFHGSFAAWAVGGGTAGAALACNSNYPHNISVWLTYGPFDLSNATAAQLSFRYYLNSESGYDFLFWGSSINNSNYNGQQISGNSGGWINVTFDLSSRLGQSQVWIGFLFSSDYSITFPYGALVDNVLVRKCVGGTCTSSLSQPEENPHEWESAERILGAPYQPPPKP